MAQKHNFSGNSNEIAEETFPQNAAELMAFIGQRGHALGGTQPG
jgi:hypothetical protein